jgi:rhodanese-related sulfurtransferase
MLNPLARRSRQLTAILLLFGVAWLSGCSEPPYTNIDNAELEQLLSRGVPLIDIRTPQEWRQTGVVPGSHKITFFEESGRVNPKFFRRFEAIVTSPDEPFALICRTGNRTSALANILSAEMGYTQVNNVQRGITNWISAGLPISR